MTMPALIANHRKQVVETRLKKFYTVINQAITMSETENGDKKEWQKELLDGRDEDGNSNAYVWYNKYLAKYLVTTKVEVDNTSAGQVKAYFPDGSLLVFNGDAWYCFPNARDYSEMVNESGENKFDKSKSGIKYFTFHFIPNSTTSEFHKNKGLEPYKGYSWDGTEEMLRNHSIIGCKKGVTNEAAYCTALIQMYGWKIPKDYPFGF